MPSYYPIFLDVEDRRCVVIGGGSVAHRKAVTLRDAGARVVVVDPTPADAVAGEEGLTVVRQRYAPAHLAGAALVIAATDDQQVNERVFADARRLGLLVNVVDRPALCSFIVPAIVKRGRMQLAVSTSGASPALARRVRERLEELFGPEYGDFVELLDSLRSEVRAGLERQADRRHVMERLSSDELLRILRDEGAAATATEMRRILADQIAATLGR